MPKNISGKMRSTGIRNQFTDFSFRAAMTLAPHPNTKRGGRGKSVDVGKINSKMIQTEKEKKKKD